MMTPNNIDPATNMEPAAPMSPVTPPPFRPAPPKKMSLGKKCVLLGLQCMVLMIGTLVVYGLVSSREKTNEEVANEITSVWGGPVTYNGIVAQGDSKSGEECRPSEFICKVAINTQSLHRSIYEAEVYDAVVKTSETFDRQDLQDKLGSECSLILGIPENRIVRMGKVKVAGKDYEWKMTNGDLSVTLNLDQLPEKINVETEFTTKGSEAFDVDQVGYKNKITINGKATNPSFQGNSLPLARNLGGDEQFDAYWENDSRRDDSDISNEDAYPEAPLVEQSVEPELLPKKEEVKEDGQVRRVIRYPDYVGVKFLVGVDRYQKVARSLKYSFFIILLTYLAVMLFEIFSKKNIPLLNYFLIGAALIIFYTLLLSFTELMVFGAAYLIAAVLTISLIAVYMGMILKSRSAGVGIGVILSIYYGGCFIMLVSTYALLLGSLLLFIALAAMMYATLKVKSPNVAAITA